MALRSLKGKFPSASASIYLHDRAYVSNVAFFKILETFEPGALDRSRLTVGLTVEKPGRVRDPVP
jgi:hypothetical protein